VNNELKNLIDAAIKARKRSYSPYSNFAVGTALQTSSGKIFAGTNVENISLALTLCAERAAVAAAVVAGERDFQLLVIVADSIHPVAPCGACRQALAEFNPALRIVSVTMTGKRKEESLRKLLPWPKRGILEYARS
jgi:cytidine deaminase